MKSVRGSHDRFSLHVGTSSYHNHAEIPPWLMFAVISAPLGAVQRMAGLQPAGSGILKIMLVPGMTDLQLAVVYELVRRDRAGAQAPDTNLWADRAGLVFLWGTQNQGLLDDFIVGEATDFDGLVLFEGMAMEDHQHRLEEAEWHDSFGPQRVEAVLSDVSRRRKMQLGLGRRRFVETVKHHHVVWCVRCHRTILKHAYQPA